MGDINAHIAKNTPDYIQSDVFDGHVPIPDDLYQPDIPITCNTITLDKVYRATTVDTEPRRWIPSHDGGVS